MIFALCLYGTTYLTILQPTVVGTSRLNVFCYHRVTSYRYGGNLVSYLFSPVNLLDRTIRPRYWKGSFLFDTSDLGIPIRSPFHWQKRAEATQNR